MIIKRNNFLEVVCETQDEYDFVKQKADNFCIYDTFEKMRRGGQTHILNKKVKTYLEKNRIFKFCRGNEKMYEELQLNSFKRTILDERIDNHCNIICKAEPRDSEQKRAIDIFTNNEWNYGILEATPSAGKTYMALKLSSIFKQKTLILVDMRLLIDQFVESILTFTNVKEDEICILSKDKKPNLKAKYFISTVQTLIRHKEYCKMLEKEIGFIIVDEVHVASCDTFQTLLPYFKPKYQIGLSGTPKRDDKKEFLVLESIGPIKFVGDRRKMLESGSMLLPILRPILLKRDNGRERDDRLEFRDIVDLYYNDKKTIEKVCKLVMYHYSKGDSQLLICKEKKMVEAYEETIKKMIKKANPKANADVEVVAFSGAIGKKKREKIIKEANEGIIKILVVTTVMDKAISINRLNVLHLLFSTRERANTTQRIGRICRSFPDKTEAIVYDYIYDHFMSFYQFYNNKENCRFQSLKYYTKYNENIKLFIDYLKDRFSDYNMYYPNKRKFENNYAKSYIVEI